MSSVEDILPEQISDLQTLLWFEGDRAQRVAHKILASGQFTIASVPETKMKIGRRTPVPNQPASP